MNTAASSFALGDTKTILDRHTTRRTTGIPTVSVLVGPLGASGRTWRRWADDTGRHVVVASRSSFPYAEWVRSVAEQVDLPAAAVYCLAQRVNRIPEEFLLEWRAKTAADRDRHWSTLAPEADDDLLRLVAALAIEPCSWSTMASRLSELGERVVPLIVRLAPVLKWPGVLFVCGTREHLSSAANAATHWAMRVPPLPIAIAVTAAVWTEYLAIAADSRVKAILREGEIEVPIVDAAIVERTLAEAGVPGSAYAMIAANGADTALVESAVEVVQATTFAPRLEAEDDRARSAAERFLFEFLESLPETAGRFKLNATLDFRFGTRAAEVDLLCTEPRIALEIDGYFHFLSTAGYRRDRAKDWELQRRGYLVLRFLAEDVIPQLELIRDRILDALAPTPAGG